MGAFASGKHAFGLSDRTAFIVYTNIGLGIIGEEIETFEATASVGSVTVSIT